MQANSKSAIKDNPTRGRDLGQMVETAKDLFNALEAIMEGFERKDWEKIEIEIGHDALTRAREVFAGETKGGKSMNAIVDMHQEMIVWVQKQAPAGNWVDYSGFPYEKNPEEKLQAARDFAQWVEKDSSSKTRIVIKTIEIL